MSGRVEGKVALITGAARGQGRAHAIRLAEEGADIIAVDICQQIETNPYPLATPEDLAQTAKSVEAVGRRMFARQGDVRERAQLEAIVDEAVAEFGRLDVVVANAGIGPIGPKGPQAFMDAVDVDLIGVINTVAVTLPHLRSGASIICTGSTAGLMPNTLTNPVLGPGGVGYGFAKHSIVSYVEVLSMQLAPQMIRVNAVHPTNCNTHLLHHDLMYKVFRPDLDHPSREDAEPAFTQFQALPIPYVEPEDIANMVLFLASEESRYVTGMQMRVDGGALVKFPNGPL
jgi:SDR family mycofactocin-dependent oxidoreductase